MSDLANLLERRSQAVDPFPDGLDRLRRRRDQRQRRRRIGTAVFVLTIMAFVVGYAYQVFLRPREPVPMDRITSVNVGLLGPAWSLEDVHPGAAGTPTVVGGRVYVDQGEAAIRSYPLSCSGVSSDCVPSAFSAHDVASSHNGFVVGDHQVYAGWGGAGSAFAAPEFRRQFIDVYARSCSSSSCSARWHSAVPGHPNIRPVAEVDGMMYASIDDTDTLVAFAPSCGRMACPPEWMGHVGLPVLTGGLAITRTTRGLSAYEQACWDIRGPRCHPVWTGRTAGNPASDKPPSAPVVVGDHVLVGDRSGIVAFPVDCADVCTPDWIGRVSGGAGSDPVVAGGLVFGAADAGYELYAFPVDCQADADGMCAPAWVAPQPTPVGFRPVVGDGYVFTATELERTLTAYPIDCSRACDPAWTLELAAPVLFEPSLHGDLVFVSDLDGVTAIPAACSQPCSPTFRWEIPGVTSAPQSQPIVRGDSLFVVGGNELFALRLGAGGNIAEVSPSREPPWWLLLVLVTAGAVWIWRRLRSHRRRLFP